MNLIYDIGKYNMGYILRSLDKWLQFSDDENGGKRVHMQNMMILLKLCCRARSFGASWIL